MPAMAYRNVGHGTKRAYSTPAGPVREAAAWLHNELRLPFHHPLRQAAMPDRTSRLQQQDPKLLFPFLQRRGLPPCCFRKCSFCFLWQTYSRALSYALIQVNKPAMPVKNLSVICYDRFTWCFYLAIFTSVEAYCSSSFRRAATCSFHWCCLLVLTPCCVSLS